MSTLIFPGSKAQPKVGSSRRDVMIHTAVTIMNTHHNLVMPGEKENEICQFAATFEAVKTPTPEHHVRQAFKEMTDACIAKMRANGLIA